VRPLLYAWAVVVTLTACSDSTTSPATSPRLAEPVVSRSPHVIVTLDRGSDPVEVARAYDITPTYVYRNVITGFAAAISEAARAGLIKDGRVERIQDDGVMTLDTVGSWGLDRIDQRALPLDSSFVPPNDGSGVTAYIIDSGIRYSHTDFGGRASLGYDFTGGSGEDCNGHGTHVAGTIGGSNYGVAGNVTLVAVRVFACTTSTSLSMILAAMEWVVLNHVSPSVVNMSLGGPGDVTLDAAVGGLARAGVTVVVSAGNYNNDACFYSPARADSAITVGATDQYDQRATFSNYGDCLDLFAPGVSIVSDWYTGDAATSTLSGTSMASPHVAGVAALVLAANPSFSPAQVDSVIKARDTKDVVINADPTLNNPNTTLSDLLYSGTDDMGSSSKCPPGWHRRGLC
jgi:subtilisin family serine protease